MKLLKTRTKGMLGPVGNDRSAYFRSSIGAFELAGVETCKAHGTTGEMVMLIHSNISSQTF